MIRFPRPTAGLCLPGRILLIGTLLGLAVAFTAFGQEKKSGDPASLTIEEVKSLRRQIEGTTGLEEGLKAKILETYDKALGQLKAAADWSAKAAAFDRAREEAPKAAEALARQLKKPLPADRKPLPKDASLDLLEQRLLEAKLDRETANEEVSKLEAEVKRRLERRKKVPELLGGARQRLLETREQVLSHETGAGPPELINAQKILLQATILATEAEIAALRRELPSYEARRKLLALRVDRALRIQAAREKAVRVWQEKVTARRRKEAERAARAAREALLEVTDASPGVRRFAEELATENSALAEQRTGPAGILQKIEAVSHQLGETTQLLKKVQTDFSSVKKRIEAGRLSAPIGVMLRQQRADLPDVADRKSDIRARRQAIENAQVKIIELREKRLAVSDVQGIVSEKMKEVDPSLPDYQRRRMERLLRELLWTKRDSLQALVDDYTNYFEKLMALDAKERELVDTVEEFASFIDERILWIRSVQPLRTKTLSGVIPSVRWMISPANWRQVFEALWVEMRESPGVYGFVVLLFFGGLWGRRKMTARLRTVDEEAGNPRCTDFGPTAEALLLTLLVAAFWPVAIGCLGWRLRSLGGPSEFPAAIGFALEFVAIMYLTLEVPRQVFRPEGLGRIHFGWPADWLDDMYRLLSKSFVVVLPAVFVIAAAEGQSDEVLKASLGRMTFILLMLTIGLFLWRMLRSVVRGRQGPEASGDGGRRMRFQRFWSLVVLGVPVAIAVVAVLGYYYAALQLGLRLHATACLVIAVLILHGTILRGFLLARRRLAVEENKKRWEALIKKQSGEGETEPQEPEEELDLAKVQVQTTRLLRGIIWFILVIGVWLIWAEVVTAFGILREVELWHTTQEVSQTVTDADGNTSVRTLAQFRAVTLADLLLALVIFLMTFLAARNLPGILQVVLLQRFGLGPGERAAISTIVQYTIVLIGAAFIFHLIGIGWGNIQWLVAALGVGIGFGLQEIVANFISGLIILFERPIRVGDAVTVGDVSGTVSKIRIRATSITTWERKELIVPNKEFVVGRLVNWTHSDTTIRVVVPVGIAYGSDTEKAAQLLLETAQASPKVLKDPAPMVLFMGFGASSLDFELRAYTNYESVLSLRHDLHMAVDKAFREAGIEIAFPQQDIHIRSVEDAFPVVTGDPDAEPST